jgi:hypothetical protein
VEVDSSEVDSVWSTEMNATLCDGTTEETEKKVMKGEEWIEWAEWIGWLKIAAKQKKDPKKSSTLDGC